MTERVESSGAHSQAWFTDQILPNTAFTTILTIRPLGDLAKVVPEFRCRVGLSAKLPKVGCSPEIYSCHVCAGYIRNLGEQNFG
ncbi:unnamed protein product [Haemonchus placei]|uniref:Uncharacterized protein n=1 Tax=Haemonchus placei TaxID=6290 RepID=A0A0N4X0M9_HAEPC|nr:unnamed protein product [Haemonchus placei]